jgi:hypothetical protein
MASDWHAGSLLVPISTDFDLYSITDGRTAPPLIYQQSRDDIVRANQQSSPSASRRPIDRPLKQLAHEAHGAFLRQVGTACLLSPQRPYRSHFFGVSYRVNDTPTQCNVSSIDGMPRWSCRPADREPS